MLAGDTTGDAGKGDLSAAGAMPERRFRTDFNPFNLHLGERAADD